MPDENNIQQNENAQSSNSEVYINDLLCNKVYFNDVEVEHLSFNRILIF